MAKGMLLWAILIIVVFSFIGCETAKGIKKDAQFIGDKTYEIIDK